ncbi:MAG: hypothetical protein VX185_04015 [Pseudomonadota bacterium]|nr:hypothetical protein [Pseudomonadota bacterium]
MQTSSYETQINHDEKLKHLKKLTAELQRVAEGSHQEQQTSFKLKQIVEELIPAELFNQLQWITDLGQEHGFAIRFDGPQYKKSTPSDNKVVIFRAEMDGIPTIDKQACVKHLCGHDLHMIWASEAFARTVRVLSQLPLSASLILLVQGSEEDGTGMGIAVSDPRFLDWMKDFKHRAVLAGHNSPFYPDGKTVLPANTIAFKAGPISTRVSSFQMSCTEREKQLMILGSKCSITFTGEQSHAANPWNAVNPTPIISTALLEVNKACPEFSILDFEIGQKPIGGGTVFGTTPGVGRIDLAFTGQDKMQESLEQLSHFIGEKVENYNTKNTLGTSLRFHIESENEQKEYARCSSQIQNIVASISATLEIAQPHGTIPKLDEKFCSGVINYASGQESICGLTYRAFEPRIFEENINSLLLIAKESGADTIQEIEPFHANINTPTITQHFKNATETQLIELESGFLWGEDNGFIGEVLNSNQELRDTTDMALNAETLMVIPGSAIGDCPNQPGLHHSGYQDPQYNMARVEVVPNIANAFSKTALAFLNAPFPPPETIQ